MTDRAVNLIEDGCDAVLRVGQLGDSSLVARTLGQLDFVNVAAPAYLREHGMPQHPADLPQHRAVNYASPTTARVEPWEWQDGGQLRTLPMPGWVRVNSAEASIACCVAGLGLLQIPRYDVQAELQSGALVEVMPQHVAQPLPVTLLQPHRQHRAQRVQVFIEWLLPVLRAGLQCRSTPCVDGASVPTKVGPTWEGTNRHGFSRRKRDPTPVGVTPGFVRFTRNHAAYSAGRNTSVSTVPTIRRP